MSSTAGALGSSKANNLSLFFFERQDLPEPFGFMFAGLPVIMAPQNFTGLVAGENYQFINIVAVRGHPVTAKRMPGALRDPLL